MLTASLPVPTLLPLPLIHNGGVFFHQTSYELEAKEQTLQAGGQPLKAMLSIAVNAINERFQTHSLLHLVVTKMEEHISRPGSIQDPIAVPAVPGQDEVTECKKSVGSAPPSTLAKLHGSNDVG